MFNLFKKNPKHYLNMLEDLGDRNLTATDVVTLKEPLRTVLTKALRVGKVHLDDFARELNLSRDGATQLSDLLVKKGLFHARDGKTYDVRATGKTYSHENSRTVELWAKFDNKKDNDKKP